jgi:hypothetical protein
MTMDVDCFVVLRTPRNDEKSVIAILFLYYMQSEILDSRLRGNDRTEEGDTGFQGITKRKLSLRADEIGIANPPHYLINNALFMRYARRLIK